MQEVSSNRSNPSILFDAGPSSRLDTFSDLTSNHGVNSVVRAHDAADHEDAELLETARSLSLTPYDEETGISDDDLMNSHHSNVYGSNLDAYSVIEPDTRPASSFTSRSHSPLIIDIDSHLHESSFHTPLAASQQDLTAASLERMQTEQASLDNRVVSPTPTLRSMTRTLEDDTFSQPTSNISPSYIGDSKTPSQAASSRPISPFSEIGNMSTHSSDHAIDFLSRRPISALSERESDKQSQWSDLGEDSSDEEEAKEIRVARLEEEEQRSLRDKRQRYFAAMSMS